MVLGVGVGGAKGYFMVASGGGGAWFLGGQERGSSSERVRWRMTG